MGKRKQPAAFWAGELQKIAQAEAPKTDKSRAQIEAEIAAISEELKGPMHNVVRLDLVEARSMLRKQLETSK